MSPQKQPNTPLPAAMPALADAIASIARIDGDFSTPISELTLYRRHRLTEPLHSIYGLGLGVVVQGDKQILLGEEAIGFSPGRAMLTTVDLPLTSPLINTSAHKPFL